MNRIYKTIWSKVRNCYVVVSEIAKSHTKSPSGGSAVGAVSLEDRFGLYLHRGITDACVPLVASGDFVTPVMKKAESFKITVAAIVKNEAENVPQWVEAARSCADEIVVVDTGSTDNTVQRFADYGITCFHYDWNDDFASAKNYMISLCHGDWIVLLDGDEWFREGCDVRKAIAKHHANPMTKAIIADWICLDKDRNNTVMFSGGAVRAFRNQPDVRYFRKVHENLTINYENFAFEPDFKMYHTGYSGSVNRSKHERNLRIMRTMFDFDNGKVEYPTDWRYIEDTYAGLGDYPKALWAADNMISFGVQEYSASAWVTKFNVLFAMKTSLAEMRKQFDFCFRTVPSVSGFRFLASIYYIRNGQIEAGLDNYIEGLRMLMGPQDKVAMEHTYWRMYMPEASALASAVYLRNKQFEASLYACKVCEQYCGQTDWTDMALADIRRLMDTEGVSVNIADRLLPVLNFSKKAVLATALISSLTVGLVKPVYAACCNLNEVASNSTTGNNSTVTGGYSNTVSGCNSSISGGCCNTVTNEGGSISGGYCNFVGLLYSYNSGGKQNFITPDTPGIVGGSIYQYNGSNYFLNTYRGSFASISGGQCNTAIGCYSSVSGGICNTAAGEGSSISGGKCNYALGLDAWVGGGTCGQAYACYSSVIGGGITGVWNCTWTAHHSVAIGQCATTTRDYEVAIGSACAPVKIGGNLTVTGTNTVTDGTTTKTWTELLNASGGGSASIPNFVINSTGNSISATGTDAVALGYNAKATGSNTVAIGSHSLTNGDNVVSFGHGAYTTAPDSTLYTSALYRKLINVADGTDAHDVATVGQVGSLVQTNMNSILNSDSISLACSTGAEYYSVAIGAGSNAGGSSSDELGNNIAIGHCATTMIGASRFTPYDAIAIGHNSLAQSNSVVLGSAAYSYDGGVAIGRCSYVAYGCSIAIGKCSTAMTDDVVSFGHKAGDSYRNLNDGSVVTHSYSLTRRLINISDGIDDSDAVTVGQLNTALASAGGGGGSLPNTLALGTCGTTAACASGTNSLAIGEGAVASGDKAISIGTGNQVRGDNSGAIGDPNIVDANNSYTVGNNSTISANVDGAFVLGNNVTVNNGTLPANWDSLTDEEKSDLTGEGVVALGNNVSVSLCNKVNSSRSSDSTGSPKIQHVVAIGECAIVGEENAMALGYEAKARALNTFAGGSNASALSEGATTLGHNATVHENSSFAIAVGYEAEATGEGANAFGDNANAGDKFATAFGRATNAACEASTAIGNEAVTTGKRAVAIGNESVASAEGATSIGNSSNAVARNAVSIGNQAVANGEGVGVVAIGNGAQVGTSTSGKGSSTAVGALANVQSYYSTALGAQTSVTANNSVALGAGSVASQANVVSVGAGTATDPYPATRKIINVTDGTSATDAATVGQTVELVAGDNVTFAEATNSIGQKKITVNATVPTITADGVVASGNTGLINGGTVYTAVNNEKTARESADTMLQGNLDAEATARENADTALSDRIGTLSADSNYIRQANNVSQNLVALDTQVKANADAIDANKTKYFGVNAVFEDWTDENAEALKVKYGIETQEEYEALVANGLNIHGEGAIGANSLAVGIGATALDNSSYAIGNGATAGYTDDSNHIYGENAIAIGTHAFAKSSDSIAIGNCAFAQNVGAVAIGKNSFAETGTAVSIGYDSHSGGYGVSIGSCAVSGMQGVSIGQLATTGVGTSNATVVGYKSTAVSEATAIGSLSSACGYTATAVGKSSSASGDSSVAIGQSANSSGQGSIAIGLYSVSQCSYSVSLGENAVSTNSNSIAIGTQSRANGLDSTALGTNSIANCQYSTAVGYNALAACANSIAIGTDVIGNAGALADRAIAIGKSAKSSATDSIALGSNSVATDNNVLSLGKNAVGTEGQDGYVAEVTRKIQHVTAGTADTDAVNVKQLNDQKISFVSTGPEYWSEGSDWDNTNNSVLRMSEYKRVFNDIYGVYTKEEYDALMNDPDRNNKNNAGAVGNNSIAVGRLAKSQGFEDIAIGDMAVTGTSGSANIAIGQLSYAEGNGSFNTAIGYKSEAAGGTSIAIGDHAKSSSLASVTIGSCAVSSDGYSVTIGPDTLTSGHNSVTIGDESINQGNMSVAIGRGASVFKADDDVLMGEATAVGTCSRVTASVAEAYGYCAVAACSNASAIGNSTLASGMYSNALGFYAHATSQGALAAGSCAFATGRYSTAVGPSSYANGNNSVAIATGGGSSSDGAYGAKTSYSIAMGYHAAASGVSGTGDNAVGDSIAIGRESSATGLGDNLVIGLRSNANGGGSRVIGSYSTANGNDNLVFGSYSTANDLESIAVGKSVNSTGAYSVVIGSCTNAINSRSIAIGRETNANSLESIAIGYGASVEDGTYSGGSIAIGHCAYAQSANSISFGTSSSALQSDSIAIGNIAQAKSKQGSVAIGHNAVVDGDFAYGLSLGDSSLVKASHSSALGSFAKVYNESGTAVGDSANVSACYGVALGVGTLVTKPYGTALGYNAQIMGSQSENAIALGANSLANENNVLSLGKSAVGTEGEDGYVPEYTRRIQHVTAGVNDTDAVNVKQLNDSLDSQKVDYIGIHENWEDWTDANASYLKLRYHVSNQEEYEVLKSSLPNKSGNGAVGNESIAIGVGAKAGGYRNISIGSMAQSESGNENFVIGNLSSATGESSYSTVYGYNSHVTGGTQNTALGYRVVANGTLSTVIGSDSTVEGTKAFAIGSDSHVTGNLSVAYGERSIVSDAAASVAIGSEATVSMTNGSGSDAVAVGSRSNASASSAIALGHNAKAQGTSSTAIGLSAVATGQDSITFGTSSKATELGSEALGYVAEATAQNATAVGYNAKARGADSVALGSNSNVLNANAVGIGIGTVTDAGVYGDRGLAIGYASSVNGLSGIALGDSAKARANNSIALGSCTNSTSLNSVAIGTEISSTSTNSIALGTNTEELVNSSRPVRGALAPNSIAIGNNPLSAGLSAISMGTCSHATCNNAIAIGNQSTASTLDSIAIGTLTKSEGDGGISIGYMSKNNLSGGLALGNYSKAGEHSVALGNETNAGYVDGATDIADAYSLATAVGYGATATCSAATALGAMSSATGEHSVALGVNSVVSGNESIALGLSANVSGNDSISLGHDSRVVGNDSGAIGHLSVVNANNSYGIGNSNSIVEDISDVFVLGNNVNATNSNTVILGSCSTATVDNVISVGREEIKNGDEITQTAINRRIINVADGINDTDVATVGQLNVATGALGTTLGNAIMYDAEDKTLATLAGTGGTKLSNLRQGTLSSTSTEAVTGAQLYAVRQDIAGFAADINRNKESIRNMNTSITAALSSVSSTSELVDTIDGLKADTSLNNLSNAGKQVIANAAINAVQEYLSANPILGASRPNMMSASPTASNTLNVTDAGNGSLHVGEGSTVNGTSSIAIGVGNQVNANGSGIFGDPSVINADASYILGNDDTINSGATGSFIVGNDSVSNSEGSLIMGSNVISDAKNGIALGNHTKISAENAVALGYGSTADEKDTVSVGNSSLQRRIVNVADGMLSADSHEAVTGGQLFAVSEKTKENEKAIATKAEADASNIDISKWTEKLGTGRVEKDDGSLVTGGTVYDAVSDMKTEIMNASPVKVEDNTIFIGKDIGGNTISVANNEGQGRTVTGIITDPKDASSAANVGYVNAVSESVIGSMNNALQKADTKMNKIGANAAALASLTPASFEGDEKWSLAAAVGHYKGETAGAVGAFYKPTENVMMNVRGAVGNGENMIGAGVAVSLNKGDIPGVTKRQLARTVNAQAEEIKSMRLEQEQNRKAWEQNRMEREQDRARIAQLETMLKQILDVQANGK